MFTATTKQPRPHKVSSKANAGIRERKRKAQHARNISAASSDLRTIPAVVNPKRREICRLDLHLFEQTYFPQSTGLSPFGEVQTNALSRMERGILKTSRILNCEPRGYCKSTKSENAILWATLYGYRRYALFFGATGTEATDATDAIMSELSQNDLLLADFPEVCYPIRALEGRSVRVHSQTYQGEQTHMVWKSGEIVFPTIPGSVSSGAVIRSKGFEGAIRGARYKLPTGETVRPDYLVFDDIQTDVSAVNPNTVRKYLENVAKLFRLGGHGNAPTGVMNATVIADDDVPDQLADHAKHPEWESVRCKTMPSLPDALESHWLGEYRRLRQAYDPEVIGDKQRAAKAATEYYRENREAMDKGATTTWQNIPLEEGEISAIQHALNVYVDDGPVIFASELQNEPKRPLEAGITEITAGELRQRYSGFQQYVPPDKTSVVVAHCDVHDRVLYWSVAAVNEDFTGSIIDYGTYPEQPAAFFTMHTLKRTLITETGAASIEEAISQGVTHVANSVIGRPYYTPNGQKMEVGTMLFDFGYKPDEVAKGIRLSEFPTQILGARGLGIGPTKTQMYDKPPDPKKVRSAGPDKRRPRWYVDRETVEGVRVVYFDANYWKTYSCARWVQPFGSPGAWSVFGNHRNDHSHWAEQCTAERPISETALGRTVVTWHAKVNRENHWGDTDIGCKVAASLAGCRLALDEPPKAAPRKKRKRNFVPI